MNYAFAISEAYSAHTLHLAVDSFQIIQQRLVSAFEHSQTVLLLRCKAVCGVDTAHEQNAVIQSANTREVSTRGELSDVRPVANLWML